MNVELKKEEAVNYKVFDIKTVNKQFKEIKDTITSDLKHKEIIARFHKILYNRVMPVVIYDSDSPEFTIYRITKGDFKGFKPTEKQSYSCPPPQKTPKGRANVKGAPVFYGAMDPMSAIQEMKGSIPDNQEFYLSKWKLKFSNKTNVHNLLVNSQTIKKTHILNSATNKQHLQLKEMINHSTVPKKFQDGFLHAIKKMGDLFSEKGDDLYHITSAYAHEIMYLIKDERINIPIITYPSVENSQNGVNWAIHPNIVNSNQMELLEVYKLSIKENLLNDDKEPRLNMTIHSRGLFQQGKFKRWEVTQFEVLEIDFSDVKVYTYNETLIKGIKTKKLEINKSGNALEKWLMNMMKTKDFYKYLSQLPIDNGKYEVLSSAQHIYENTVLMKLEHGCQVKTPKGMSCIHWLTIPFKWTKKFIPVENS